MIAAVLLATYMLRFSWSVPSFGEGGTDCRHPLRVPATWDSVRFIVDVYPTGAYQFAWHDTLLRKRGDGVFYAHPTPVEGNHLVGVKTQRLSRGWPTWPAVWIDENCPEKPVTIVIKPVAQ